MRDALLLIEWLIDYVRVYKDKNGYDEKNRPTKWERFLYERREALADFASKTASFFRALFARCQQFFARLLRPDPVVSCSTREPFTEPFKPRETVRRSRLFSYERNKK